MQHYDIDGLIDYVANGDVDGEVRCILQSLHIAGLLRRQQQPKARNGHGKRVQVHA